MPSSAEVLEDYWQILGLAPGASKKDVTTAYRKKSLVVHPDRYKGDDPKWATDEFLRLTRAKEVLEDDKARAAFEAVQRARAAHREKQDAQDSTRRRMREDLEVREEEARKRARVAGADVSTVSAAKAQAQAEAAARQELQRELERLRRAGRLGGGAAEGVAATAAATLPASASASAAVGGASGGSGGELLKATVSWSADGEPWNLDQLRRLLIGLGAPADLLLAVVGCKAVAEVTPSVAARLSSQSTQLSARGLRLSVQQPPPSRATATGGGSGGGSSGAVAPLAAGWKEETTADGKTYYYHTTTRQTQWTRPEAAAGNGGGLGAGTSATDLDRLEEETLSRLAEAARRQKALPSQSAPTAEATAE